MSPLSRVKTLEFSKVCDPRGNLSFIEEAVHVPFSIKRVFYIYDIPGGATRGAHAHHNLQMVLICVSGSMDLHLSDGTREVIYHLNNANEGVLIPPGVWNSMHNFSSGTTVLVLCSEYYDEADYIRDFEEFKKLAASGHFD